MIWLLLSTASAWNPSTGVVWTQDLAWQLNNQGSQSLPDLDAVEQILLDSYASWEDPTCTAFTARYDGRTGRRSTNNGDDLTVHGFTSSWPASYGDPNSVLGNTVALFNQARMLETDVTFNEEVWVFVDGNPAAFSLEADLQSIATHEFGHALGLDHTDAPDATMQGSYDGGTRYRTLANDDVDGVCALYPLGGVPVDGDAWEPNDSAGQAAPIACDEAIDAEASDDDWYRVTLQRAGPLNLSLSWSNGAVDLDLHLFDDTEQVAVSNATGTRLEAVSESLDAGTYFVLVVPYAGEADYTLGVDCGGGVVEPAPDDDGFEDNDEAAEATPVDCPTRLTAIAADDDWFVFETTTDDPIQVRIAWEDETDLDLYLVDESGLLASSEASDTRAEELAYTGAPGVHAIVVSPRGDAAPYELFLACDGAWPEGIAPTEPDDTGDPPVEPLPLPACACDSATGGWPFFLFLLPWVRRRR